MKNYKYFINENKNDKKSNEEIISDFLLKKILQGGMSSLTKSQKYLLDKISTNVKLNEKDKDLFKFDIVKNVNDLNKNFNIFKELQDSNPDNKKIEVGDTVVYNGNKNQDNLPKYASDFLNSNKNFKVLRINKNDKLDIGCSTIKNGVKSVFYFSSSRFTKDNNTLSNKNDNYFDEDEIENDNW